MGRPAELTKKDLIKLGITNVSETGVVETIPGKAVSYSDTTKKTRYGYKTYWLVQIYDHDTYKARRQANPDATSGTKTLVLSRVIWAWNFDGSNRPTNGNYCPAFTAPANLDIDHINDNSEVNDFTNLQLLTRKQNLAKRRGHMNQYERSYKE